MTFPHRGDDNSGHCRSWTKSALSHADGNCVEVADLPGGKSACATARTPAGRCYGFRRKNGGRS